MELTTTSTALGTPVGALKAKVVHLLWLNNGDDNWSLCDKKVRGNVFVRDDAPADTICQDCIDERDFREAKAAKFEHAVSYRSSRQSSSPIAGSRGTYLNAEVYCRDCAMGTEKFFTVWSSNGTTMAEAEARTKQHYISMWRAHKAAGAASTTEPAESETAMTTENTEPAGWTSTPALVAGARTYTHPQYDGWKIYQTRTGGAATVYQNGETVGEYDSLPEAITMITENVVPENRRVDLNGQLVRRRETISAIDHEKTVRGMAETLDPSAFDGSDPSAAGKAGENRRQEARATARELLKSSVDPNREIPDDEYKALVALETAERIARLSIQILGTANDLEKAPHAIDRVSKLLSHQAGITSTRLVTAVKRPDLADRIAQEARFALEQVLARIDPPLEFTGVPEGFIVREKVPGASKSQRAFDIVGGGYAVFTRIGVGGTIEIEFTQHGRTSTMYAATPNEAMEKLVALRAPDSEQEDVTDVPETDDGARERLVELLAKNGVFQSTLGLADRLEAQQALADEILKGAV